MMYIFYYTQDESDYVPIENQEVVLPAVYTVSHCFPLHVRGDLIKEGDEELSLTFQTINAQDSLLQTSITILIVGDGDGKS